MPVAVVLSCAALAAALAFAVTGAGSPPSTPPVAAPVTAVVVTTRPPVLSRSDITRFARALGIRARPEHEASYWKAADPERSIVLQRGPRSWYVLFTDSSVLLDAPLPGTHLPQSAAAPAPSAAQARAAARSVLYRAGALPGEWRSRTGAAAEMPVVCRPVPTLYNCTELRLKTRHVVFTRVVRGRPTTVEWEVLVGPGSRILDAVGRIAVVGGRRPHDRR
jgi:hypothetical protein